VPTAALVAAACGVLLVFVALLAAATDRPFAYFSRDPASTLDASAYVGVISHVGVLLAWGAAAAALLAGAFVARARGRPDALPLFAVGAATGYLALDDLFLLHENVYPELGIRQEVVLVAYGLAAIAFLWWYRELFRAHEWPLLALAVVLLGASLALDLRLGDVHWLEDGLKLVGLALWAAYVVRLGSRMLADAYPLVPAGPDGGAVIDSAPRRGGGPRA
jgi:hypothetical protein